MTSDPVFIGAVADIHGNFDALRRAMERHADVALWICVGDLASITGAYPEPPKPLYWIKGNNEDFDRIAAWEAGEPPPRNLHFIRNGTAVTVGQLRVAALGGTYAPKWFDTAVSDLPRARSSAAFEKRDDKRRHFVRDEVLACKALSNIDLFMTHEAPRPFYPAGRRIDAGKTVLNDVLAALRPRLHLFGHHHEFTDTVRQGVRSIGLDIVTKSYLLVDAATFKTERLDT